MGGMSFSAYNALDEENKKLQEKLKRAIFVLKIYEDMEADHAEGFFSRSKNETLHLQNVGQLARALL